MRSSFVLVVAYAAALTSCREEEQPTPSNGGVPWMSNIAVSADTSWIMAPNVITPNGDGINDVFCPIGQYVNNMHTTIWNTAGSVVFSSDQFPPCWTEVDTSDLGRYRVQISAVALSGHPLITQSYLDVLDYGEDLCLSHSGTPVTGDQLDPRVFGVPYPTNEIFCE